MTPLHETDRAALFHGDCREVMRGLPSDFVDSIVTDPPYEIGFMGRAWDASGIAYSVEVWREALRILKPGGHLLAFGGTRTYHRMACAIEDAGFEIRDSLSWLYGQGMPKGQNISKAIDKSAGAVREVVGVNATALRPNRSKIGLMDQGGGGEFKADNGATITAPATEDASKWEGWNTQLKPAMEPIVMARKPLIGTVAANVIAHGTGGLNVGACRLVALTPEEVARSGASTNGAVYGGGRGSVDWKRSGMVHPGRFPANVLFDEEAAEELDAQSGSRGAHGGGKQRGGMGFGGSESMITADVGGYGDTGGASRFFYVAKANKRERADNDHPTVKPIELMRYLVRLVTPPDGIVFDPFTGSGTTGIAALREGFNFVGSELHPEKPGDPNHIAIALSRIATEEA